MRPISGTGIAAGAVGTGRGRARSFHAHGQSYYDQIQLQAGPDGTVIAVSAKDSKPIVVAGECGKGRYVAIGLAVGLAANNEETEPEGAEAQLLLSSVAWAGGAKAH